MCGIAGIYCPDGNHREMFSDLHKMNEAMMSRGLESNIVIRDNIGMVHRRLSLVGGEDGKQPMENDRYLMVSNSEIYNYKDLGDSKSDTKVLFDHLCADKSLHDLNGDFAVVLWDKKEKLLKVIIDRYGIRQLFYAIYKNRTYFASNIRTLLSVIPARLNWFGMSRNLQYKTCSKPYTLFKGISAYMPGCIYSYTKPILPVLKSWYCLPKKKQKFDKDKLEYLIKDSISLRKHEKGALMLSGGIDSCLLAAMGMSDFAVNLEDAQTEIVKRFCKEKEITLKTAPNVLSISIDEQIMNFEQPYYSLSANAPVAMWIRSNNKSVAYNGLGPDELLAGYHYYKPPYGYKAWRDHHTMFSDQQVKQMTGGIPPIDVYKIFAEDSIRGMNKLDLYHYIGSHHLYRGDNQFMAYTIEGRYPYLDHRIVEYLINLPDEWKINKRALREVAKKYLPDYIMNQPKYGLSVPMQKWIHGDLKGWIEENLLCLKKLGWNIPVNLTDNQRFHLATTNRFLELFRLI